MINVGESLYERKKPSVVNSILNVVLILIFIMLAFLVIFNLMYTSIYVDGESMMPTLMNGDYVFIDKHATPDYGDIVVVKDTDKNIIKRVVAFGGDTVKIESGQLYVKYKGESSFTKVTESYIHAEYNDPTKPQNTFHEQGDYVVEEGCMFVLGDNRSNSTDSRRHGDFPMDKLVGVVPSWAIKNKGVVTPVYAFFKSTLPKAFGFK